ncbi:MAG: chemotaxis protein CheX [Phycisphaerales bacterium]|nr:chemotaxis protein CheX [Phycisphaerales bacterium]
MNAITTERLSEMVTEALERTCFLVTDPSDPKTIAAHGYTTEHCARIAYSGPDAGHVYVCASGGFLQELASSLLGCEPDEIDLDVEGQDAIRELANIMGGSVILDLGGDRCDYRLGLPELSSAPDQAAGALCALESASGALQVQWVPATMSGAKAA